MTSRVSIAPGVLIAVLLAGCSAESPPPSATEVADPVQEARFNDCVAKRDHQIHREVFAAVDNPDVQRELLATRKELAIKECREQFPKSKIVGPQSK